MDFSRPTRDTPLSHPPTDPLLCKECQQQDLVYFDPCCDGCQEILLSPETTIPQIFAVMRQWVPQVQQSISSLTREVLRRGAHVDDKDGLSDLTLLHYAVKSGADGMGRGQQAVSVVQLLLNKGADCRMRCRWTDMNPLHFAAFFNVKVAVEPLLETAPDLLNTTSSSFDNGSALHIAAQNGNWETLQELLSMGADPSLSDMLGKIPLDCLPEAPPGSAMLSAVTEARRMLEDALENPPSSRPPPTPTPPTHTPPTHTPLTHTPPTRPLLTHTQPTHTPSIKLIPVSEAGGEEHREVIDKGGFTPLSPTTEKINGDSPSIIVASSSKPTLKLKPISTSSPALVAQNHVNRNKHQPPMATDRLKVGDHVLVGGQKSGVIRYSGPTKFAEGWWFGVELNEAKGKNNGSVNGERYFTCSDGHGVFAPPNKVQRLSEDGFLDVDGMASPSTSSLTTPTSNATTPLNSKVPTISKRMSIEPSTGSGRKSLNRKSLSSTSVPSPREQVKLKEGMNVYVHGTMATLRYVGGTDFADGTWLGVEFKTAVGRHNGTVKGKTYFSCKPNHGLLIKPSKATFRGISCSNLIKT